MRTRVLVVLLALTHIVLAITYANIAPYRQPGFILGWGRPQPTNDIGAPDERAHANYLSTC